MKFTCAVLLLASVSARAQFTPLTPLPAPRVVASATAYPGGSHEVAQLIDGNAKTEYSSDGKGTDTFVEFDFGAPARIGAFRHVDRNDPATIAASELVFSDASGGVVATVPVAHVNQRGGETFFSLPSPVTAQRARWRASTSGRSQAAAAPRRATCRPAARTCAVAPAQ
jgi:hypothetical protein